MAVNALGPLYADLYGLPQILVTLKFFHQRICDKVVRADKMLIRARGPGWTSLRAGVIARATAGAWIRPVLYGGV